MNVNKIQFSPDVIIGLCDYLGITLKALATETDFDYTAISLYAICKRRLPVSAKMNKELNRLFFCELGLDSSDLLEIYKLNDLRNKGKVKFKNRKGIKK